MRNPFVLLSVKTFRHLTRLTFLGRSLLLTAKAIVANPHYEWGKLSDLVALTPKLVIGCKAIRYDVHCGDFSLCMETEDAMCSAYLQFQRDCAIATAVEILPSRGAV